jgi:hypothetical protein
LKKRAWITAGIVVASAFIVFVIVEVIQAGRGLPPLPPSQTGITMSGGHVRGNHVATKSWTFDYTSASLSPDGTTGTVEGVRNGIVYKKGKPHLRISAEEVSLDTQTLDFTAIGKVHVQLIGDQQQRVFDTDLVSWTNATKLLHFDHPSYLRSAGGQVVELQSIVIDFNTDKIHVGSLGGSFTYQK